MFFAIFLEFHCSHFRAGIYFEAMARAGIRTEADLEKLVGWKCLKGVGTLLAHLHEHHDCPNRKLHYDQYASLLLF